VSLIFFSSPKEDVTEQEQKRAIIFLPKAETIVIIRIIFIQTLVTREKQKSLHNPHNI